MPDAAASAAADARIHHGRPRQKSTTAETVEVRRVEWGPCGLTARRKRARTRFISVLIATIERFQGWRRGPSGVGGLGIGTAAKNAFTTTLRIKGSGALWQFGNRRHSGCFGVHETRMPAYGTGAATVKFSSPFRCWLYAIAGSGTRPIAGTGTAALSDSARPKSVRVVATQPTPRRIALPQVILRYRELFGLQEKWPRQVAGPSRGGSRRSSMLS
jgi:hypothetical protein